MCRHDWPAQLEKVACVANFSGAGEIGSLYFRAPVAPASESAIGAEHEPFRATAQHKGLLLRRTLGQRSEDHPRNERQAKPDRQTSQAGSNRFHWLSRFSH